MSTLPAACCGVRVPVAPPAKYSGGFKNAVSRGTDSSLVVPVVGFAVVRATSSSSIECPKR